MTEEQARDIIENTIKAHWQNWDFKGQELAVWVRELLKFDYDSAKQAINSLYLSWQKDRYPKIAHIMGAIRRSAKSRQTGGRQAALFGIFRQDGTRRSRDFWGSASTSKESVRQYAELLCEMINQIYDEKHFIQYYSTDEEPVEGYYGPDARQRAIEEILARPDDDKTKIWLQKHLSEKKKKSKPHQDKPKEPVRIGDVVEESNIPF